MNDVAREAGCSQTTVSFVLSGQSGPNISAETTRRVIEAAAALGYRRQARPAPEKRRSPSAAARRRAPLAHEDGEPGRVRSRTAWVTNEIGLRVIGGIYSEGEVLPGDADLMQDFKVSRTVLRETMKTLAGKGLLPAKSRIGTRVRPRSEWHLFDPDVLRWHARTGFDAGLIAALSEIRLIVEVEAAALAARRRKPEQLAALYQLADRMAAAHSSRRDFVDADLLLHLEIGRVAGNPFLPALSSLIEVALVAALTRSSPVDEDGGVAMSAAAHRAIVDAIAQGDETAARSAMRNVIDEGIRRASAGVELE